MKHYIRKKIISVLVLVCFLFGTIGVLNIKIINNNLAHATSSAQISGFYGANLAQNEKRFYLALKQMAQNDLFLESGAYDLIQNNVVSQKEVADFENGSDSLIKQFNNAKNAFELDNPDIFYVDYDVLTLSLGKKSSGYTATIDAGRHKNYTLKDFSGNIINDVVLNFNGNSGIKTFLPTAQNLNQKEKIEFLITKILSEVEFKYSNTYTSSMLNSAYSAFKHKKASSEGIAKIFKVCLDLLEIENIVLSGYVADDNINTLSAHYWNYAKVNNVWYAFDIVTAISGDVNRNLFAGKKFENTHISNIASSVLPTLVEQNYNDSLLEINSKVQNNNLVVEFSFNGKSATELKQDGLYLVVYDKTDITNSILDYGTGKAWFAFEDNATGKSEASISEKFPFVKIAVTMVEPDELNQYEILENSQIICSKVVENSLYPIDTKRVKPVVEQIKVESLDGKIVCEDVSNVELPAENSYKITLTYSEDLEIANPLNIFDVCVEMFNFSDINSKVKVEDVEFSDQNPNTISFTFTPSRICKFSGEEYVFLPFNFIRKYTAIRPYYIKIKFARTSLVATKINSQDEIGIQKFTNPVILNNNDINFLTQEWKNKEGNTLYLTQKDSLVLINNIKLNTEKKDIINKLIEQNDFVTTDIVSSEVYNLSFDVSGKVSMPNNIVVNYGFSYPEGCSYQSLKEGVIFKAYTYTMDNLGNYDYTDAKELDCIALPTGLVVSSNKAGEIAIVAIKNQTSQNLVKIYSSVKNIGGNVVCSSESNPLKRITTVSDESVTYLINTDSTYKVDYVLLNGKNITSQITNNSLEILKTDLKSNNILEVAFVETQVATAEADAGIVNLNLINLQNAQEGKPQISSNDTSSKSKSDIITILKDNLLYITIAIVGVVAVILIIVIVIKSKKKVAQKKTTKNKK